MNNRARFTAHSASCYTNKFKQLNLTLLCAGLLGLPLMAQAEEITPTNLRLATVVNT